MKGRLGVFHNVYPRLRDRIKAYLFNADPLAACANAGAFLVWSNQPFYPIYVALLVGRDAWPSLLTWLSTPFFVGVPLLARAHPLAARALFVVAGVVNTLVSLKAFGVPSGVSWFLIPCLIIAATFFRRKEWKVAATLFVGCVGAALLIGKLGAPLHVYSAADYRSLTRLNVWSVAVLSLYLLFVARRARRAVDAGSESNDAARL